MPTVDINVTVTMEHRKAASACHGAPLELVGAELVDELGNFTCSACGQPATRVLGDPVTVVASNG